ncbi:hypothetical protein A9Q98_03100 [Thalassotalea sp. 42_200_T64]|nr:hypothetical protein A9Q98_03100 [Thalassotalea sp. 42_200_T64]
MDLFFLKKLIGQLLMPLPIIIIALCLGLFLLKNKPKHGKILLISATCILFLFAFNPIASRLMKPLEAHYSVYQPSNDTLDYIVILGCGHTSDERLTPSQELKICSLQRLVEGIRIAKLHPQATIVTSGWSSNDKSSNADKVKQAAIELGIEAEKIIAESRPKDTEDEAMYIAPLLIDKTFVLVTNANHMPRSMAYFEKQGVTPIPAPTGFYVKDVDSNMPFLEYFPQPNELEKSQIAWYETLGRIWQWLKS